MHDDDDDDLSRFKVRITPVALPLLLNYKRQVSAVAMAVMAGHHAQANIWEEESQLGKSHEQRVSLDRCVM